MPTINVGFVDVDINGMFTNAKLTFTDIQGRLVSRSPFRQALKVEHDDEVDVH